MPGNTSMALFSPVRSSNSYQKKKQTTDEAIYTTFTDSK